MYNDKPNDDSTQTDVTVTSVDELSQGAEGQRTPTRVSFSTIQIRHYNRIIGDHPDAKNGPPLAIGWEFAEDSPMEVTDYEQAKQQAREASETPYLLGLRRWGGGKRRDVLQMEFGYTLEEIQAAEQEAERVREQRSQTYKQKKFYTRGEELAESFKRKLRRTLHTPAATTERKMISANYPPAPKIARPTPSPAPESASSAPFPSLPPPRPLSSIPKEISV